MLIFIPGLVSSLRIYSDAYAYLDTNRNVTYICVASESDRPFTLRLSDEDDGKNIIDFIAWCVLTTPDTVEKIWMYDATCRYKELALKMPWTTQTNNKDNV